MMPKLDVDPYEFDRRTLDWCLKNKKITPEQVKEFMKALPDDAAHCESLEIEHGEEYGDTEVV